MRVWSIGASFTWTGLGSDLGLRHDMSATNCPSHGEAFDNYRQNSVV